MALMYRIRVASTGWEGAPGLNTVYFDAGEAASLAGANACYARVQAGFTNGKDIYPSPVSLVVSHQVDVLDPGTGETLDTIAATGADTIITPGAGGVLSPPATAALLKLQTARFVDGRRVLGRFFISPLRASHISSGLLTGAGQTAVLAIASGIMGSPAEEDPHWAVWHRPRPAQTPEEHPPDGVTERVGDVVRVTTTTVPTKLAVLRSRRD